MTSKDRLDRIEKILSLLAEDHAKSEKRMTRLELQIKSLLNIAQLHESRLQLLEQREEKH